MANWSKFILTEKGKEMQAKADAGTILTFSKVRSRGWDRRPRKHNHGAL